MDANFDNVIGNTTPVGSYAANFYGLLDMGGNVWEWTEDIIIPSGRGWRGGGWESVETSLSANNQNAFVVDFGLPFCGFRIASPVPGPGPAVILAGGVAGLGRRRR